MRQFINGSEAAFANLERQARGQLVIFRDQEMPLDVTPARTKVGVEVNQADGSVVLFVDRGTTYTGENLEIRAWLEAGERRFASFADMISWILDELAACYRPEAIQARSTPIAPENTASVPHAKDLTDISEVEKSLKGHDDPIYLEPDELLREMSKQVRGQDSALQIFCPQVCHHIARRNPSRPATFFAVGPTGVGKTKTGESLPLALKALHSESAGYSYVRLDMSEYQESHRISQLFGAPQGYIGYGEGAQLVDALAANPRTVVLFDEIEKAHPNILRSLMNAMDAGRISTATATVQGREIDCRHAIFIFTSNLEASDIIQELTERKGFDDSGVVDDVCRRRLRSAGIAPELVGRIRRFLVFRSLTVAARVEIITLAVARVAGEYGLQVGRIEPSVIINIMDQGRSNEFGARPGEYLVDEMLGSVFAKAAEAKISSPIEVCGPPFKCILLDLSAEAAIITEIEQ